MTNGEKFKEIFGFELKADYVCPYGQFAEPFCYDRCKNQHCYNWANKQYRKFEQGDDDVEIKLN